MSTPKIEYKKISNSHFSKLCELFHNLLDLDNKSIISDMVEASIDDNDKNNITNLYKYKDINMDVIKLDDMTAPFLSYMRKNRKNMNLDQPKAVDAVCVNKNNECFLIEFKNRPIYKNNSIDNDVLTSIRRKMFESLWLLFTIDSLNNDESLFNDATEFARTHVTYIVVVSREKNPDEYRRIRESNKNLYTPDYLKKYIGYYIKDAYLFTENELARFINNFKC